MGEKGECDKDRVEGGAGVRENYGKEIMKKKVKKRKEGNRRVKGRNWRVK